jgi:hypothetical protein
MGCVAMLVYRVETIDGDGPYVNSGLYLDLIECNNSSKAHPHPSNDDLLEECWGWGGSYEYSYAFESIEHYKEWFYHKDKREEATTQAKGHLVIYDAPEGSYTKGAKQVMFLKDKATFIDLLPLNIGD